MKTSLFHLKYSVVLCTLLLVSCAVQTNQVKKDYSSILRPSVNVPDDGNSYIVVYTQEDINLRPNANSPKIGIIYGHSTTPKIVRVYSYIANVRANWWEILHDGSKGYISPSTVGVARIKKPAYPPEKGDPLLGYNEPAPLITGASTSPPNSAGGIDVRIGTINPPNGDIIKYSYYTVSPYNAVGDRVSGRIRNRSSETLRNTGPWKPGSLEEWDQWVNVFYNQSVKCIQITEAKFEYINGKIVSYNNSNISQILHKDFSNNCSYTAN